MPKFTDDPELREKHIIEKALEPFAWNFGHLQDVATFLGQMARYDISPEDLRLYINKKKLEKIEQKRIYKASVVDTLADWKKACPRCPECGYQMNLFPVNTSRRTRVGGGYNSQWLCGDHSCMHTYFSDKTVNEWYDELLGE